MIWSSRRSHDSATGTCGEPVFHTHHAVDHLLRRVVSRARRQPNDLLVWDNRMVLHRALPYDEAEHRLVWHISTCGERPLPVVAMDLLTPSSRQPGSGGLAKL